MFDWNGIVIGLIGIFAGGGIWTVLKAREDKKKTPYDMLMEMLAEQKRFYTERNAEFEREKLISAEKSAVIMKTHNCKHRFDNPDIVCPVDEANDARLKNNCARCAFNDDQENSNTNENN